MYARAKTVDFSAAGMQIEVQAQVPVNTAITVRCDELKISTRGTVRYCTRQGARFRVGVEFSAPVRLRPTA